MRAMQRNRKTHPKSKRGSIVLTGVLRPANIDGRTEYYVRLSKISIVNMTAMSAYYSSGDICK
jgi:hypothetical protein